MDERYFPIALFLLNKATHSGARIGWYKNQQELNAAMKAIPGNDFFVVSDPRMETPEQMPFQEELAK